VVIHFFLCFIHLLLSLLRYSLSSPLVHSSLSFRVPVFYLNYLFISAIKSTVFLRVLRTHQSQNFYSVVLCIFFIILSLSLFLYRGFLLFFHFWDLFRLIYYVEFNKKKKKSQKQKKKIMLFLSVSFSFSTVWCSIVIFPSVIECGFYRSVCSRLVLLCCRGGLRPIFIQCGFVISISLACLAGFFPQNL
jgi:hypothetical protein